jgi:hypothetical protein
VEANEHVLAADPTLGGVEIYGHTWSWNLCYVHNKILTLLQKIYM